jgi:hypothetical protein
MPCWKVKAGSCSTMWVTRPEMKGEKVKFLNKEKSEPEKSLTKTLNMRKKNKKLFTRNTTSLNSFQHGTERQRTKDRALTQLSQILGIQNFVCDGQKAGNLSNKKNEN